MPWRNGDYPPSYKNLPKPVKDKAIQIANALLEDKHMEEGVVLKTRKNGLRSMKATNNREAKSKPSLQIKFSFLTLV
jgi:uncharacterized protein YdaT